MLHLACPSPPSPNSNLNVECTNAHAVVCRQVGRVHIQNGQECVLSAGVPQMKL